MKNCCVKRRECEEEEKLQGSECEEENKLQESECDDETEPLLQKQKRPKELSCRNVTTFVLCVTVYLCCNITFALLAPFFPLQVSCVLYLCAFVMILCVCGGEKARRLHSVYEGEG